MSNPKWYQLSFSLPLLNWHVSLLLIDENSELSSCDIPVCFMIYYGCLLDLGESLPKGKMFIGLLKDKRDHKATLNF